ncbi:MAG: NAD-dependent epimerase/dehydratase family protein [Microbacteriaceae bacterium]|nr:MAG: NAD-dependent epimerase/dehydratase family protein [Microbacteriaceae bacterium]
MDISNRKKTAQMERKSTHIPPRRVLLTGGLGFIGTKVIERIHPSEAILVVDNLHPQVHQDRRSIAGLPARISFVEGDVADERVMHEAVAFSPDVVVHLAAETGTGQSLLESRRHAHVNVTGTATLLDALSASGKLPDRLIVSSSRAVYGEGRWSLRGQPERSAQAIPRDYSRLAAGLWLPEGPNGEELEAPVPSRASCSEARPSNVYAATKLAQENLAAAWCLGLGVPLTVLRLQNVYGEGQAIDNPYTGVLTLMARQALAGEQINVYEGGGIVRDFVNVTDAADAIFLAIQDTTTRDVCVDIGSGKASSLLDVAKLLSKLTGAPTPRVSNDFRAGDVRAAYADLRDAKDQLGYVPRADLGHGLAQLLSWVEKEMSR